MDEAVSHKIIPTSTGCRHLASVQCNGSKDGREGEGRGRYTLVWTVVICVPHALDVTTRSSAGLK